jgi:hypothetical protein
VKLPLEVKKAYRNFVMRRAFHICDSSSQTKQNCACERTCDAYRQDLLFTHARPTL